MTLEAMRRNGIIRPDEVVELAGVAKLDLTAACVLLVKESGGGANVWGRDAVVVAPGTYVKAGPVTRENYTAYRAAVRAGRAGRQGVGPTQLTAADYQDAADRAGGCWDWRTNVLMGFRILAGHITRYGVRGGFVAYNGGPGALAKGATHPAQLYGDDAARKLVTWRPIVALVAQIQQEEDVPITDADVERIARRTADLTATRPTTNGFGDVVELQQIVAGGERRTADLQDAIGRLLAGGVPATSGAGAAGSVDLDALAGRIVDLLARRLATGR